MNRSNFTGIVYFDRQDYTNKVKVSLGEYSVSRGHNAALKKLEKLYPGGWLYDILMEMK